MNHLLQLYIVRDSSTDPCINQISDQKVYKLSKQDPWTVTSNDLQVICLYGLWYYHTQGDTGPPVTVTTDLDIEMLYPHWIKIPNRKSQRKTKKVQRYTP